MGASVLIALSDATRATSGGKAAALAVLLAAGLPVPNGFVVTCDFPTGTHKEVARELHRMGDPVVAVRSSAMSEDTERASAAGQYDSILAIRGVNEVCEAIAACKDSGRAARVLDYWRGLGRPQPGPEMAVLVQRIVDADVSGVMFTSERTANRPVSKPPGG